MGTSGEIEAVVVHWAGLDVSKKCFDAALLLNGALGQAPVWSGLPVQRFERSPQGVSKFVAWLDERCESVSGPVRCVMETTGRYSVELAAWLLAERASLAPAIVHAKHASEFERSLGARNRTDESAARALALLGLQRQPKAYVPASKEEAAFRELVRHRHTLVAQQTVVKNQMKESVRSRFVAKEQGKWLRSLEASIKRVEKEMKALLETMPAVKEDVERLQTMHGVGFIVACVVRAELGDLNRFERARQLTAHCGLNPSVRQSGTSVRGKTHMSKQGNEHARHMLYMAATAAIQCKNDFALEYKAHVENGMPKMAAIGIIMRKMLVVMRRLIVHRETYNPYHKNGGKLVSNQSVEDIIRQTAQAMSV
jgi:transposase